MPHQVSQTAAIVAKTSTPANESDKRLVALDAAAQRIGEVVSLISAIAAQTNLLALNATIEAARLLKTSPGGERSSAAGGGDRVRGYALTG